MTVTSDITCLVLLRRQSRGRIPKLSIGMVGLGTRGVIIMIALLIKRISAYDGK